MVGPAAGGCWCRRSCPTTRSCAPPCSPTPADSSSPNAARRELLGLPPFAALAAISGAGSDDVAAALGAIDGIQVGGTAGAYTARAATWEALGRAITSVPRPKGARLRVAVDPPRQ